MTETPEGPQGLRDAHDRSKAALAVANEQLMTVHLGTIGLDPAKGLGKAIAKSYEGTFSADAIAAYALDEFSHEPVAAVPEPVTEPPPVAPEPTDAEAAQQAQTQVMGSTEGAPPIDNEVTPQQKMDSLMPKPGQAMSEADRVNYYGAAEALLNP